MTTPDTNRSLRDVRRQQANDRRALREQRQQQIERRDHARKQAENKQFVLQQNAVIKGMVPRISGAIDSWAGKRVPLRVECPAWQFSAYTDFTSITLNIPALREGQDMTLDFAADLRGLAYHEAGHILVSVPFVDLLEWAAGLDQGAMDYARDRWIENVLGMSKGELHHAWNCLEDQRMESAMVRQSANLGRYYNVIVLTHVLSGGVTPNAYLLLYGRKHVDASVRAAARTAFVQVHGEDTTLEAERLIDVYKAADTLQGLWETSVHFARLMQKVKGEGGGDIPEPVDGHGDGEPCPEGDEGKATAGATPSEDEDEDDDESDSTEDEEGDGEGEDEEADDEGGLSDGDGDEDAEGDEADGEADDDDDAQDGGYPTVADRGQKGQGHSGGDRGADESVGDPDWNNQTVRDAIRDAKEERQQDRTIQNDVRAYNEALQEASRSLAIPRVPVVANPDPSVTFEASKLNRALRNLMEQARAERAPSWQEGQRHGVVNVIRYKTRQPGDMEFFRDYADGGDMHLPNMAVSVLLDGSGSMLSYNQDLAQAAFGMKSACDVVGIPCTVTIFDTAPYLLWDKDDRPLDVPLDVVPGGGTDPKPALDLLDLQQADKANHLVIIMTDGAWGGRWHGQLSLDQYMVPNRDLVLFFWKCSPNDGPRGMEACSTTQRLNSLDEMPQFLRRYITRAM